MIIRSMLLQYTQAHKRSGCMSIAEANYFGLMPWVVLQNFYFWRSPRTQHTRAHTVQMAKMVRYEKSFVVSADIF